MSLRQKPRPASLSPIEAWNSAKCIKFTHITFDVTFHRENVQAPGVVERKYKQEQSEEEVAFLVGLGEQIRAARQVAGLGQEELATRSGVHRTNLWKIETGQLDVRILTLQRLAAALELSVDELLKKPAKTDSET